MKTIYTIGHSRHPVDHFLHLLRRHAISTLVDIRSHPYSRWAPHFQQNPLSRCLAEVGIEYVFLGRELGGRPDGPALYDHRGRVDYVRRAQAPDFLAGIDRLGQLASTDTVAILCAEENPERCHRRLLVTPALKRRGIAAHHIRGDGRVQRDEALDDASEQLGLFEE